MEQLRDQFNSMLEGVVGRSPMPVQGLAYARMWDFELTEDDTAIHIRAELPGFETSQIDVHIHDDTLTIDANRCEMAREGERCRDFYRSLVLPAHVDADAVTATYRNGVLDLRLPKTREARAKHIPVRDANAPKIETNGGTQINVQPGGGI
jgi:HSP20 family protein